MPRINLIFVLALLAWPLPALAQENVQDKGVDALQIFEFDYDQKMAPLVNISSKADIPALPPASKAKTEDTAPPAKPKAPATAKAPTPAMVAAPVPATAKAPAPFKFPAPPPIKVTAPPLVKFPAPAAAPTEAKAPAKNEDQVQAAALVGVEGPTLIQIEAPALVQIEDPALVQIEAPALVQIEDPALVQIEAPAAAPAQAKAPVKTPVPAQAKAAAPAQAKAAAPAQAKAAAPVQAKAAAPVQAKAAAPVQAKAVAPAKAKAPTQAKAPIKAPTNVAIKDGVITIIGEPNPPGVRDHLSDHQVMEINMSLAGTPTPTSVPAKPGEARVERSAKSAGSRQTPNENQPSSRPGDIHRFWQAAHKNWAGCGRVVPHSCPPIEVQTAAYSGPSQAGLFGYTASGVPLHELTQFSGFYK